MHVMPCDVSLQSLAALKEFVEANQKRRPFIGVPHLPPPFPHEVL